MRNIWAFAWGALVGVIGGLIGLGGAEFRLPILVAPDFSSDRKIADRIFFQQSIDTCSDALFRYLPGTRNRVSSDNLCHPTETYIETRFLTALK